MKTKEKNKVIAEWLELELNELYIGIISAGKWYEYNKGKTWITQFDNWHPDKDRNQQRLIEDKLTKLGYDINYKYNSDLKTWFIDIHDSNKYGMANNKFKDIAFIEAIIKLINNSKNMIKYSKCGE